MCLYEQKGATIVQCAALYHILKTYFVARCVEWIYYKTTRPKKNVSQLGFTTCFQIISDGMSAYLTAAGGYYQPVMTAQQLAGLGAQAGHPGLAAYAAAAPPTVSQAATAGAEARLQ